MGALPLWAGMPSVTIELTDLAKLRVQSISFFVLVFLVSAGLICLVWNFLRRDFSFLPRLSFLRALGVTTLWGLLFVLVLTMISGARELLTPGAWKKQGWTYTLDNPGPEAQPPITEEIRRKHLEELRFALWDHARKNGGFPQSPDETTIPTERWLVPGPSGMRYLYAQPPFEGASVLAWEPEVFGLQRLVLFSDGAIGSMDSASLARILPGGRQ